ncbi:cilia- and flagella-associated protein 53 [Cynoglossus semilaevis]|uniref:cilia- and flagella-associated protein 53 n=1 Tax=Cynoglossus semilaevis TaxID=244447 RepID=UPI000497C3E1|nr:cilia- and flagella-associated protein 53-like [Cynoglossus semilaevis]
MQRTGKCREKTRTAPHCGVMMTPRQESIIEDKTNAIKSARASDAKVSWMQNTQRHFLREEINRRMRAAQEEHENDVEQRRSRLKQLLKQEEEHTLQEMERRYDTTAERKKKMIALARQLRDKREKERQQYISHQLDRQFRVHCEELRVAESKRRDLEGNLLREAQLKTQQELQQEQEEEERVYHELWKADARAKEERERQTMELQMQRHAEQQSTLLRQIEESKETKQKMKEQRLEEAARLKKLQEENLLLDQREKQQKVEERNTLRRLLDHSLTLKNDRLRREKEAELQQTKEFLAQVQQELMQDQEDAMRRKLELKAEQKAFHEYWQNHRDMEDKDEAEVQRLIDEALQKGMKTADERKLQLRQARGHLTTEVSDGRGLQMVFKRKETNKKKKTTKKLTLTLTLTSE